MASSLEHKTVRPGNLGMYSYYRSARRPAPPSQTHFIAASRFRLIPRKLVITVLIVAALIGLPLLRGGGTPADSRSAADRSQSAKGVPQEAAAVVAAPITSRDACDGNNLDKLILVSINQRHLWACNGSKSAYDTPVITGMSAYASTVTPAGTYHIYGKQTDTTLTGSDQTGSWNDPVSYWMPFLDNQYGTYGFHDATWRNSSEFGNVSADSSKASHGCVELPLGASKWLYNWSAVGTTVTIKA